MYIKKLTIRQFFARFPDVETCLTHVMEVRYGLRHECRACKRETTFYKIAGRRGFACSGCGDHVYPCAGTIFQDNRKSLQSWFYAIYLFVSTRPRRQRTLGVTYKTACGRNV